MARELVRRRRARARPSSASAARCRRATTRASRRPSWRVAGSRARRWSPAPGTCRARWRSSAAPGVEVSTGCRRRSGRCGAGKRFWRWGRERVLAWSGSLVWPWRQSRLLLACSQAAPAGPVTDAAPARRPTPPDDRIARAEDLRRRAKDVPVEVAARPRSRRPSPAARAFARILDADDAPLLRALDDDDDEVVAWARLRPRRVVPRARRRARAGARPRGWCRSIPRARRRRRSTRALAILRALGRCGGDVAEQTLRAWLRRAGAAPPTAEAAAFALGDVAVRARLALARVERGAARGGAARRRPWTRRSIPSAAPTRRGDEPAPRLLAAARGGARPSGPGALLRRAGPRPSGRGRRATDLARVLSSSDFTPAGARRGRARPRAACTRRGRRRWRTRSRRSCPISREALVGRSLRRAAASPSRPSPTIAPKKAEAALWAVTRLEAGADATRPRSRGACRSCAAPPRRSSRGRVGLDVLRGCDVGDGEAGEQARLAALDHGDLARQARRAPWLELTRSKHVRVREAAIEAIDAPPGARRRGAPRAGRGARVGSRPASSRPRPTSSTRTPTASSSWRRARSGPRSIRAPRRRPPTRRASSTRGSRRPCARRSRTPWTDDLVETRVALLDAALAVSLDEGKTVRAGGLPRSQRDRARSRRQGARRRRATRTPRVPPPETPGDPAAELIDTPLAARRRASSSTPTPGTLGIRFDPGARARGGHALRRARAERLLHGRRRPPGRPGLRRPARRSRRRRLRRLGDSLRCETSPVPFGALDVGVALAGRDTGSSQISSRWRGILISTASTPGWDAPRGLGRRRRRRCRQGRAREVGCTCVLMRLGPAAQRRIAVVLADVLGRATGRRPRRSPSSSTRTSGASPSRRRSACASSSGPSPGFPWSSSASRCPPTGCRPRRGAATSSAGPTSQLYLLREGFYLLKAIALMGWGAHPAVRAAHGPRARWPRSAHDDDAADFVVIGSGAAGATAALVLAEAGRDVVVLEEGPEVRDEDRGLGSSEAFMRLFRDAGTQVAMGRSVIPILQGRCLGGTTVVNGAIVWRLPEDAYERVLRRDRAPARPCPLADAPCAHGPHRARSRPWRRRPIASSAGNGTLMKRGPQKLGWKAHAIRRNVVDCQGSGRCLEACPTQRKQSMERDVPPARGLPRGAASCPTTRCASSRRARPRAVAVSGPPGGRVARSASRPAAASSSRRAPSSRRASCWRSGLGPRAHVGAHFRAHPGTAVAGVYRDPVRIWEGATQSYEVDEFREQGFKMEVVGLPVELAGVRLPGLGQGFQRSMARLPAHGRVGRAGPRRGGGPRRSRRATARASRTRRAGATWSVFREGVRRLCEMHFAAGAVRVYPGVHGGPDDAHVAGRARQARRPPARSAALVAHRRPSVRHVPHGAVRGAGVVGLTARSTACSASGSWTRRSSRRTSA